MPQQLIDPETEMSYITTISYAASGITTAMPCLILHTPSEPTERLQTIAINNISEAITSASQDNGRTAVINGLSFSLSGSHFILSTLPIPAPLVETAHNHAFSFLGKKVALFLGLENTYITCARYFPSPHLNWPPRAFEAITKAMWSTIVPLLCEYTRDSILFLPVTLHPYLLYSPLANTSLHSAMCETANGAVTVTNITQQHFLASDFSLLEEVKDRIQFPFLLPTFYNNAWGCIINASHLQDAGLILSDYTDETQNTPIVESKLAAQCLQLTAGMTIINEKIQPLFSGSFYPMCPLSVPTDVIQFSIGSALSNFPNASATMINEINQAFLNSILSSPDDRVAVAYFPTINNSCDCYTVNFIPHAPDIPHATEQEPS